MFNPGDLVEMIEPFDYVHSNSEEDKLLTTKGSRFTVTKNYIDGDYNFLDLNTLSGKEVKGVYPYRFKKAANIRKRKK